MSLESCAELVRSADPDRYAPTQLAPAEVQGILWPIYAFNIEVSRAPWVTQEPMLAEIRLQWWRDALEEIREKKQVRSHEVTVPLSTMLDAEGAMSLDRLVDARKWEIYADPFKDEGECDAYIDATYGNLMWTAARLIDPKCDEGLIRKWAYGCGVAAMLRATANLTGLGRNPLPKNDIMEFEKLAKKGLSSLNEARAARRDIAASLAPLMLAGWQAVPTLQAALKEPETMRENGFAQSEFSRRLRLTKLSFLGWWR